MRKIVKETLFEAETKKTSPVDNKKLSEYAKAIDVICNGEYGSVYFNEAENSIEVIVGDANPFDTESLKYFMQEAVAKDWKRQDEISITIENEVGNPGEGWKLIK